MTETVRPTDDVSGHIADTTDAHDASAISFSPVGTIASTDVQAAIAEVASEAGGGPFTSVGDDAKFASAFGSFLLSNDETVYLQLGGADAVELNNTASNRFYMELGKAYFLNEFGLVLPVASSDPSGGDSEIGQVYYNDGSNKLRWYNGSVWADLGGAGHTHVYSEVPSGTINGSNAAFTLAATPASGTLRLYKNGLRQRAGSGNDYTLSTNTITYEAGNVPQTGDSHVADYNS